MENLAIKNHILRRKKDGKIFRRYFYCGDNVKIDEPPVYLNRPSWYIDKKGEEELELLMIDSKLYEVIV